MNPGAAIFGSERTEHFRTRGAQFIRSGVNIVDHEADHRSSCEVEVVRRCRAENLDQTAFREPADPEVFVAVFHFKTEHIAEEVDCLRRGLCTRSDPSKPSDSHARQFAPTGGIWSAFQIASITPSML